MDSIRVLILQKVFAQCAKMLDPQPKLAISEARKYGSNTPGHPDHDPDAEESDLVDSMSEYYKIFRQEAGTPGSKRFDFDLLEPGAIERMAITRYIKFIRFGTGPIVDYDKRGLLPALFLETGTDSFAGDFRGIEQAKVGEVMPVVLRLWSKEDKVSARTEPEYRQSNPIFIAQFKEQLDYLLDRSEFVGISMPRIGYSLPSSVYDCQVRLSQALEGVRSPWECVDFRFEVTFDKQKEIDDRYSNLS